MYVAINYNPLNSCKIQNTSYDQSQIILLLKVVEMAKEENVNVQKDEQGFLHWKVLEPWYN